MMWPLLSNGLSEVGQLSAVSVRGPTRLTNAAVVRVKLPTHVRDPDNECKRDSSTVIRRTLRMMFTP